MFEHLELFVKTSVLDFIATISTAYRHHFLGIIAIFSTLLYHLVEVQACPTTVKRAKQISYLIHEKPTHATFQI